MPEAVSGSGALVDAHGHHRRPTLRDVARTAGVSQSTTSRALRGQGYVAVDVRERVQDAAAELGYVPDGLARHLRDRVSRSIGVLVSDLRNPFYADVATGASRAAKRAGYSVMLIDDRLGTEEEVEAGQTFASMRVAGVVLTPLSAEVSRYLQRQQIPVVEVDRQFAAETCDAVVMDNQIAAQKLVEHLLALGHRRIALVSGAEGWSTGRDRAHGYELALRAAGVPVDDELEVSAGWDVTGAHGAAVRLLQSSVPPTAIFAASTVVAEGVWLAARDLGLVVPDDVSIVSFDEAPWMTMVSPSVTTVRQDGVALGEAAVVRLLERIHAPATPVSTQVFRTEVTVRGSSGPAGAVGSEPNQRPGLVAVPALVQRTG